jgi:hypothetical protein
MGSIPHCLATGHLNCRRTAGFGTVSIQKIALFLSSGNKICASGNRVHALNWFYSANSRTELGMVRELKSRQSDGAAK